MRKIVTFFALVAIMAAHTATAQNISVSSAVGQNVGTFLMNNLVGEGVYIYNAKFNGHAGSIPSVWPQIGSFTSGSYGALSMDGGVLLTTGRLPVAVGPNDNTSASNPVSQPYVDQQMNQLLASGQTVNECATLDFDFVSLSDFVSFTYCFGSEEYREFVFSQYNDVFAFFLTGPDPLTGDEVTRNIAIIPGTVDADHPDGIPVAINTVNNGSSNQSAQQSYLNGNCEGCYMYDNYFYNNDTLNDYYSATPLDGVQYDGLTVKLTASSSVIPCQSYHMHISVCNVGDESYDSGVFLEGGSFTTPSAAIGLSQMEADSIRQGQQKTVQLSLANTGYETGTLYIYFGGEAISGIDYFCMRDDGTVVNNGETLELSAAVQGLTILPLANANLASPKSLDLYFRTALCEEHPELLVYDTMRFYLVKGPTEPVGIDGAERSGLVISPNPTSNEFVVTAPTAVVSVRLTDAAGREVYEHGFDGSAATVTGSVAHLAAGVYGIEVGCADGRLYRDRIVKR